MRTKEAGEVRHILEVVLPTWSKPQRSLYTPLRNLAITTAKTQDIVDNEYILNRELSPEESRQILNSGDRVKLEEQETIVSHSDVQPNEEGEELNLETKLAKFRQLQNPKLKFKIKKEADVILDTVYRRLEAIGFNLYDVPLPQQVADFTVTRLFISSRYGGAPQGTFTPVDTEKFPHGYHLMYTVPEFNPAAPQRPGANGAFFSPEDSTSPKKAWIWKLIVFLETNKWLYTGEYELIKAQSLTPEEWRRQSEKVKHTWVTKFATQKWGRSLRARIVLRQRLKREPSAAELVDALSSSKDNFDVSQQKISKALSRGQETIAVYLMKCVGYDEDFQKDLYTHFPRTPAVSPATKRRRETSTDDEFTPKKKKVAIRRK